MLKMMRRVGVREQFEIFTAKKNKSIWNKGELVTQLMFVVYVVSCVYSVGRNTENISACGYNQVVPWYVGCLFYCSATASNHSLMWFLVRAVRTDETITRASLRMFMGAVSAFALYGTMYFPRCFWTLHQSCVLAWTLSTSSLMLIEIKTTTTSGDDDDGTVRHDSSIITKNGSDHGDNSITIINNSNNSSELLAQHHQMTKAPTKVYLFHVLWFTGFLVCCVLYYQNNYAFFFGESMASMAFSAWAMSKHLGIEGKWKPRKYGLREYFSDALCGCLLYYFCEKLNRVRLCPRNKLVIGPSLIPSLSSFFQT